MAEKKTISAKEVVADIKAGMSNEQLMAKYGLSARGLQTLFDKLLKAGLITQAVLDQRRVALDQAEKPAPGISAEESPRGERTWDILEEFARRFKIPRQDLDRLKTASAKDIKDFLTRHNISLAETGPLLKALGKTGLIDGIQKLQESGRLGSNPVKLLAIAGSALMIGWFAAALLTARWSWFLVCLGILTGSFFLVGHYLAKRSTLGPPLTVKHFALVGAVFLVLNIGYYAFRSSPRVVVVKQDVREPAQRLWYSYQQVTGKDADQELRYMPLILTGKVRNIGNRGAKDVRITAHCATCVNQPAPGKWVDAACCLKEIALSQSMQYLAPGMEEEFRFMPFVYFEGTGPSPGPPKIEIKIDFVSD